MTCGSVLLEALHDDEPRTIAQAKLEGNTNKEIARQQGGVVWIIERQLRTIRNRWKEEPAP